MGKTVGELHAMLIEYEKGLPKKAETPQVMMIKSGKIQKANKKSLNAKGKNKVKGKGKDKKVYIPQPKNPKPSAKEHPAKDDTCHHCKEVGHCKRNCPAYLAELIKKKKKVGTASSSDSLQHAFSNLVPPKKVDNTPYELWYDKFPNRHTKVWGLRRLEGQECRKNSNKDRGRARDLEEIQDEDTSPSEITSEIPMEVEGFEPPQEEDIPIRRSEMTRRAPDRLYVEVEEHSIGDLNEPTSYKAAMLDSESNKWIDAMNAEIQSMMDNMVWVLVDLPSGCKTVGSKWIFKKKTDMDGIVHTYKACLVAKGYTQLYGVDYEETFSPIADIRAIRILISIAAYNDYEIWQMDIKTAFLNGYLDEDIYMVQPGGFVDPNHPRKDLGEAAFILRIKIYRDRSERLIRLSQNAYMDKILKRYKMDNSKRGTIPMQERLDLNKSQGAQTPKEVNHMKNVPYASAVGSIMYAVRCIRPDVAFAQNLTSRFQQISGELHWTAVKNILKYLRNTKNMFLVYSGNPEAKLRVNCYCNTRFEIDIDDMKSLTGYVSF
ncbi:retrotransposon protein, putative, ty1-copia subclass [Tanacetum coccineum]